MKPLFFMMPLLIPGPSQPGKAIDVYLRPLVDELKELWENGVSTYDASSGQNFQMKPTLLWTILDFPAYGNVFGWSTKGYHAYPICNDETFYERLRSKIGYTNHHCYLPKDHAWRMSKAYNGKIERKTRSLELPIDMVQDQLDQMSADNLGKHSSNKRVLSWTKVSILHELPY